MVDRRVKICVVGAAGRMGRRLVALVKTDSALALSAAIDKKQTLSSGASSQSTGAAGLRNTVSATSDASELSTEAAVANADVVVDFSAPAACQSIAPLCAASHAAYVVGSTGLSQADHDALDAASKQTAVLHAANFSVGVNTMLALASRAAASLGEAFDVEISELHHRHKRDAPSGTATALAQAVRRARSDLVQLNGRAGPEKAREHNQLGVAALRGGDVTGDHTVFFLGEGERLELIHRASTPDIFARGALRAAKWLNEREAGRYSMQDVLGDGGK